MQAAHGALVLLDEARAAVPADVEEAVRVAVVVAHEEQALVADPACHEAAALRQRVDVANADPAAEEDVPPPTPRRRHR